ncbi:MAG TPA: hypothetical protein VG184_02255 [Acidimicrobiales bacterium]|jgi:hypothetical protein|nr:hypothetical protein [Acidimicrobiales bacterium]
MPAFAQNYCSVALANRKLVTQANQVRGCAVTIRDGTLTVLQPPSPGTVLFQARTDQVTAVLPKRAKILPNVYVRIADDRWLIDFSHVASNEMSRSGGKGMLKVFAGAAGTKSISVAKRIREDFVQVLVSQGGHIEASD